MKKKEKRVRKLDRDQVAECKRLGELLMSSKNKSNLTSEQCAKKLGISYDNLRNRIQTLKGGQGWGKLDEVKGWISQLNGTSEGPVKRKYNKTGIYSQQPTEKLNWADEKIDTIFAALKKNSLSVKVKTALWNEVYARFKTFERQALSSGDVIISAHDAVEHLSTSMTGEEMYEIPADTLLIRKTAQGIKLYAVKPAPENPRVQHMEAWMEQFQSLMSRMPVVQNGKRQQEHEPASLR